VQIAKPKIICKPIAIVPVHTIALRPQIKVTIATVTVTVTVWPAPVRVGNKFKLGKI
jgi:hypothetical protein